MKPNDFQALLALPQVQALVDDLLNMPMVPRTCKWKLIFKVAHLAYRRGTSNGLLITMAQWQGMTPLHLAVFNCLVDNIRVLVEAGADLGARNALGHTPLESAQLTWGGGTAPGLKFKERERFAKEGEVPELVRKMLTPPT